MKPKSRTADFARRPPAARHRARAVPPDQTHERAISVRTCPSRTDGNLERSNCRRSNRPWGRARTADRDRGSRIACRSTGDLDARLWHPLLLQRRRRCLLNTSKAMTAFMTHLRKARVEGRPLVIAHAEFDACSGSHGKAFFIPDASIKRT
jgi:hypothetical protein